ncbi:MULTISPECIES: recombinase family protein [Rhodococcus]|uniref:recombinase family protein n=1 Tax=Rhodococcus TaxID=1827 RepID=UPI00193B66B2|nr:MULTISPECIES: recombinase family protein [Rhodococcus]QRI74709.1 recombinase family protein [Rhodococcus aetherivorans]QSE58120.1 recombinase family protein [Rhodococcus sp. PSBB066]
MTQRVAVYLRQSQDRDGTEYGIQRQREDVLRLVQGRGWTVAAEYVDNDTSATSRKPRPGFEAMMEAVDRGEVDVIAARHVDRLVRRLVDLEGVLERCHAHGTTVVTASDGVDTATDGGRLVVRILGSVAQGEMERKSARQKSAMAQAAAQGRYVGGRRAFGYEQDGVTIRPDEAALIVTGYEAVLAGESLAAVARMWNESGIGTTQGGTEWERSAVKDVLINARNAGLRRHRPEGTHATYRQDPTSFVVGRAVWEPIVPEDTWRAVVAILTDPSRRKPSQRGRNLLTSVALCGVCEEGNRPTVHAGGARRHYRIYRCRDHHHLQRMAEPVDEYVEALMVARLSRPDALAVFAPRVEEDTRDLSAEADVLRRRLEDLAADYMHMTREQFRIANESVRSRLAEVEAEIAAAGAADVIAPLVTSGDVAAAWSELSTARKRSVIDTLVTVTLYSPGRGRRAFDPETVGIDWKTTE